MSDIDKIKKRLVAENFNVEDLALVEKQVALWKDITETEKFQSEAIKLKRNETKLIPLLSIIIPAFLTAITLLITVYQFNRNNEMQRKAEKESSWRDFLKQLSNFQQLNDNLTVPSTLASYINSEDYSDEAKKISLILIPSITDVDMFNILYDELYKATNWQNFTDLTHISKGLNKTFNTIQRNMIKTEKLINNPQQALNIVTLRERYSRDSVLRVEVDKELSVVSKSIIKFINRNNKPKNYNLNLESVSFYKDDLSKMDLSRVSLYNTELVFCDVTGADFSNVTRFASSNWYRTQWWKCSKMSSTLRNYLIKNFPYNPNINYLGTIDLRKYYSVAQKNPY